MLSSIYFDRKELTPKSIKAILALISLYIIGAGGANWAKTKIFTYVAIYN